MKATSPHPIRGIVPILVTPFTERDELDVAGIRSQVDFCLSSGAHAILYPGVVSEFYTLTDQERRAAVEECVDAVAGRVPVAIGVSATSTVAAVEFAHHAAGLGVDAVMAMTPFVQHFFTLSFDDAREHLASIARAAGVPLILQNARIGHAVSLGSLSTLLDAVPQIAYVKQETNPTTHDLTAVLDLAGERLKGVFGGLGGIYLVNELERGALGSMPAPPLVDVIVRAYETFHTAGAVEAQAILDPLGSLFTRELLYNAVFIKEILQRRGVINTTRVRIPSPQLDKADLADLDRILPKDLY